MMKFAPIELERCARDLLAAVGVDAGDASWTAELLLRSDLAGHPSHGLVRLVDYVEAIEAGAVNASGRPHLERDDGSTAVVHGDRALGQVAARFATDEAVRRARAHGIACVALRHSAHAGRLADYASRVADAGQIGLIVANDAGTGQSVAPPGALEGRLSTNPLAFGFPRQAPPHFVVDFATSVASFGKIRIAQESGQAVPTDWMRDGVLQAFGGYKGFGLALAVEALAGVLSGAGHVTASSDVRSSATEEPQGLAVIAIDVTRFGAPGEFSSSLELALKHVASAPVPAGADPVAIPGERGAAAAALHRAEGVSLTGPTVTRLVAACQRLGVASVKAGPV